MKNKVITGNFSSAKVDVRKIKIYILNILKIINLRNVYLEIYILPPRKMKYLNRIFRSQNKESSILSFREPKIPHPYFKRKPLGEIYLSSAQKEKFNYLLIHGLLHLLGYKHGDKMDRKEMEIRRHLQ